MTKIFTQGGVDGSDDVILMPEVSLVVAVVLLEPEVLVEGQVVGPGGDQNRVEAQELNRKQALKLALCWIVGTIFSNLWPGKSTPTINRALGSSTVELSRP